MAKFEFKRDPDPQWDDRCFLTVDERYTMSIVRTHDGIEVLVWPINNGQVWDMPSDGVRILDAETEEDPHPAPENE